ncbi:cation diffusion facilitator family transporter [Spirochaeta isovalerica]|uniref:Cation diffusion facilitator family transporter n=2 Tax=Spirochaeta isovalerica TaxID=150 RepID=A0A841R561_9SPIO|nr:cation diffusion facilitator family transporter [Spirochaeta isovalerica]
MIKIVAGILGHSQAMIADGIHSLSDLGTDIVVIVGMFIASRPKDESHNYGHGKYETLSALIIAILLSIVGLGIGYSGVTSAMGIFQGRLIIKPHIVTLLSALISIIVKESLFRYTIKKGKKINSSAVIANAYHHRSDAFSSLGAAAGISGAILMGDKWVILDPVACVIVSFFIIKEALHIGKNSINELLEVSLPVEIQNEILNIAASVPEVQQPHNLKTRRIGNISAVDMHILLDSEISIEHGHSIAHKVEEAIKEELGDDMIFSIHIEPNH